MKSKVWLLLALAVLTESACYDGAAPGEVGRARLVGLVSGSPPEVLPPVMDRDGNIYVLRGRRDDATYASLSVIRSVGGAFGPCTASKGDVFGVHGFVGVAQSSAWYWAGDALVAVHGNTGHCRTVLDKDPSSGASLSFRAVVPEVRDSPSVTSVVAMIKSPSDKLPFFALVDLRTRNYGNLTAFSPADASAVEVLGVGADTSRHEGIIVVRYQRAGTSVVEALYLDEGAALINRVALKLPQDVTEYGISSYLRVGKESLVAGVLPGGRLLTFDASGGRILDPQGLYPGFNLVGVHAWDGQLHAVGVSGGVPEVAFIDNRGDLSTPVTFEASLEAQRQIAGGLVVLDDRRSPTTLTEWPVVSSALGEFPLVSPHQPVVFARSSTLWLFRGPGFDSAGEEQAMVAVASVGIEYP